MTWVGQQVSSGYLFLLNTESITLRLAASTLFAVRYRLLKISFKVFGLLVYS